MPVLFVGSPSIAQATTCLLVTSVEGCNGSNAGRRGNVGDGMGEGMLSCVWDGGRSSMSLTGVAGLIARRGRGEGFVEAGELSTGLSIGDVEAFYRSLNQRSSAQTSNKLTERPNRDVPWG